MNKDVHRKKVINDYKSKKEVGGVYRITNTKTGKMLVEHARSLHGVASRFDFSQKMNSCFSPKLLRDWNEYGKDVFVFEILDEIEMKETQTIREFNDDLKELRDIWKEKYTDKEMY